MRSKYSLYPNLHFSQHFPNIRIPINTVQMKNLHDLPCYGAGRRKPPDARTVALGHLRQGSPFILKQYNEHKNTLYRIFGFEVRGLWPASAAII